MVKDSNLPNHVPLPKRKKIYFQEYFEKEDCRNGGSDPVQLSVSGSYRVCVVPVEVWGFDAAPHIWHSFGVLRSMVEPARQTLLENEDAAYAGAALRDGRNEHDWPSDAG